MDYPELVNPVVDAVDARALAEFYRELFGLTYRPGDEPDPDRPPEDDDWMVLFRPDGSRALAVQQVEVLRQPTWPDPTVPMQMHLDFFIADPEQLELHRQRALDLGATELLHRTDEPAEPLYVLADPEGHPFCLFTDLTAAARDV